MSLVDTSQLKAMRRLRKGMRFVGIWFTLIGGFLFYQFLGIYLDPDTTILYNGVPTTDESIKLNALIFVSFFVITGLFFYLLTKQNSKQTLCT